MSAVETSGIELAIGGLLTKQIHDLTFDTPALVGFLMGLDNYYVSNAPGSMPRIRKGKVGGGVVRGKMRSNFFTQKPSWQFVDAMDPVLANRQLELIKRTRVIQGTTVASAIQFGEPFDKYELAILEDQDEFKGWVKRVSHLSGEAYIEAVNNALFPNVTQVGGLGQADNNIGMPMAFAYPLQTGFTNNEQVAQGAEVYMYQGIDMNTVPRMKALNVGKIGGAYTYTWENLRGDLIVPLKGKRGSKCDLAIHGSDTYEATRTQAAGTLRQTTDKTVQLPGEWFQTNDGTFHLLEPQIDNLPYKEIYVGDSSSLAFGLPDDPMENVNYIDPYPGNPSMAALEGFSLLAFVNERPWQWGRAFNVVLA